MVLNIDVQEIGKRFKQIRHALGLTQTEIAKELNCKQLVVSRVERGEKVYSPVLLSFFVFYSQKINLNYLFSNQFDVMNQEQLYNPNFEMNSIVKEKLLGLISIIDDQGEKIKKQVKGSIDLL